MQLAKALGVSVWEPARAKSLTQQRTCIAALPNGVRAGLSCHVASYNSCAVSEAVMSFFAWQRLVSAPVALRAQCSSLWYCDCAAGQSQAI
jgi:hypothetical protein